MALDGGTDTKYNGSINFCLNICKYTAVFKACLKFIKQKYLKYKLLVFCKIKCNKVSNASKEYCIHTYICICS